MFVLGTVAEDIHQVLLSQKKFFENCQKPLDKQTKISLFDI